MNNNKIEEDLKKYEKKRKKIRVAGIIGAVISGLCFGFMLIVDEFSPEALALFIFSVFVAVISKKEKWE